MALTNIKKYLNLAVSIWLLLLSIPLYQNVMSCLLQRERENQANANLHQK